MYVTESHEKCHKGAFHCFISVEALQHVACCVSQGCFAINLQNGTRNTLHGFSQLICEVTVPFSCLPWRARPGKHTQFISPVQEEV